TAGGAACRRFCSAVRISTSWRRRASQCCNSCVALSGNGRTGGRIASAKWANTAAEMASVLASWPVARPKSRTWRGLTTTTRQPAPEQRAHPPRLEASRGLEHDEGWLQADQAIGHGRPGLWLIVDLPALAAGPYGDIQVRLCDIDTDEASVLAHACPVASL